MKAVFNVVDNDERAYPLIMFYFAAAIQWYWKKLPRCERVGKMQGCPNRLIFEVNKSLFMTFIRGVAKGKGFGFQTRKLQQLRCELERDSTFEEYKKKLDLERTPSESMKYIT